MSESRIVDVAVPLRVNSSFHYLLAETQQDLSVGSIVEVDFNRRKTHAFVLGFPEKSEVEARRLKPIGGVLVKEALFDSEMLRFLRWVADYYCHPLGEVIAAAIPKQFVTASEARKEKAVKAKPLETFQLESTPVRELTEHQSHALAAIQEEQSKPILLHGVTGSGKTEIYLRAIERAMSEGKGAMILVPEIALTPQLLGRFSSRFPDQVSVLHSDLTASERLAQWEKLRRGMSRVVIGARSAVFAPVPNLGLIVVDEEHETTFKQEDSLRYHARDVAIVRARLRGAKIILGSATPSLESYWNAQSGRYRYLTLPERVHRRPLPRVSVVDLREKSEWVAPQTPWLSRTLLAKIRDTVAAGQQALLYLNRLGYAHFLYCSDCGHTWRCRQCDVALTYYQKPPSLKCHYCGSSHEVPHLCEGCSGGSLETLGVGTEQVEKELRALLPTARIARMDRSVVKTRSDLEMVLSSVSKREVDIVIGTQMLAKGHDFPGIALVGILMADATLNIPDFRANERTFQILTQVSGRAGRGDTPGEVVLQTLNPETGVLGLAMRNDAATFYKQEIAAREQLGFPPAKRLAMLRFQHKNAGRVEQFAEKMVDFLISRKLAVQVLGPAEAPLSKLKNLYRWHCLIKSDSVRDLQQLLWMAREYADHLKSGVQMAADVDPVNCM